MRKLIRLVLPAVAALFVLQTLQAAQIKIADMNITWTKWYFRQEPPYTNPDNWMSPYNYGEGTAYFRIETTGMGDGRAFYAQPCLFQDSHTPDKHSCFTRNTGMFTVRSAGVMYVTMLMQSQWQYNVIDYTRKLLSFMVIDNLCNEGCRTGAKMRFECIVVSKGGTFEPPAHWTGNPWGTDETPPQLSAVSCTEATKVKVTFSETPDNTTATNKANYAIDNSVTISSASLSGNTVTLTTSALSEGVAYTLTVNNVKDKAGNVIAANTKKTFQYTVFRGWAEDFDDGTADGWTVGEGTWAVIGGKYVESGAGRASTFAGDPSWTDITYTADVTPTSGTDVWMIFRVQDKSNYYLFTLSGPSLYKLVNGTYTKIQDGTGSFSAGNTYSLKVELAGTSIKIYSGSTLVLSAADTQFSSGYVGFGANNGNGSFDNAMVTTAGGTGMGVLPQIAAQRDRLDLAVSPSPFRDAAYINLIGHRPDGIAGITVTDLSGVPVRNYPGPALRNGALVWDGNDGNGRPVPDGLYLVSARDGDRRLCRSVMLLR